MKTQLNKLTADKYWHINDLVLCGGLPGMTIPGVIFPDGFKKLISKKTREYKMQEQPFSELPRVEAIDRFLTDFRFIGKDGKECLFNEIQKIDLGLCIQKRYSLLNWQMGSGKTAASYAWSKYLMTNRSTRNVFIISAAISIYLTWVPFMKSQNENFIVIESPSDIKKIKSGMFVLVSLSG